MGLVELNPSFIGCVETRKSRLAENPQKGRLHRPPTNCMHDTMRQTLRCDKLSQKVIDILEIPRLCYCVIVSAVRKLAPHLHSSADLVQPGHMGGSVAVH